MADPVVKALDDLNRTLKDLVAAQREQTRVLKALNLNYIEVHLRPQDKVEPQPPEPAGTSEPPYIPKTYGWSAAALVQREGGLRAGDIKIEEDESRWVWIGPETGWERVEAPSAREPD